MTFKRLSLLILVILAVTLSVVAGCQTNAAPTSPSPSQKPAVKLAFTTQPGNGRAGSEFNPAPVVAVQDADGNTVTGYRTNVVLTLTPDTGAANARLRGGTTLGLSDGIARFSGLTLDKAGTGFTLTATSDNLQAAVSAPFNVTAGDPARLAFSVDPTGTVAGTLLPTQPEVVVQDFYGNPVTGYSGSITIAIAPGTGIRGIGLTGTTTIPASDGVARFKDLALTLAIPGYKLLAMGDGLESATSGSFTITPGTAAKLEFTVPPADAVAGEPFYTQPKVAVEDQYGNVVNASDAVVTVSLTPGKGTSGAVLSGKTQLTANGGLGGLAEYKDLAIDKAGTGYQFTAVSSGLTSAVSPPFDVAP